MRTGMVSKVPTPEVVAKQQRIKQLLAEREVFIETLRVSDERLVRYLANSIRYGVSQEQLESPMLKIVGENSVG
jgi:hypothetical protein